MSHFMEGVEANVRHDAVIIYMSREGAMWLHGELPEDDGFTRDLWFALDELGAWDAS